MNFTRHLVVKGVNFADFARKKDPWVTNFAEISHHHDSWREPSSGLDGSSGC